MCGTYFFSSSVWELNNQNYEIFAVFHRCPRPQLRQDKGTEIIDFTLLNTSNVRRLEITFFKPAILFDFVSNVLLSSLSVLSVSSGSGK